MNGTYPRQECTFRRKGDLRLDAHGHVDLLALGRFKALLAHLVGVGQAHTTFSSRNLGGFGDGLRCRQGVEKLVTGGACIVLSKLPAVVPAADMLCLFEIIVFVVRIVERVVFIGVGVRAMCQTLFLVHDVRV